MLVTPKSIHIYIIIGIARNNKIENCFPGAILDNCLKKKQDHKLLHEVGTIFGYEIDLSKKRRTKQGNSH